MPDEVVVAGAGFGGLSAALSMAGKGYSVKLIDKKKFHSYTPGLIDLIRNRVGEEKLKLDLENFLEGTDVEFYEEEITSFEPEENRVLTEKSVYDYENLVVALGSKLRDFGNNVSGLEKCYTYFQAESLARKSDDAGEALVVGAGYVGIEIAGELAEKGLDVRIVDMVTRPLPNCPEKASEIALEYMNKKGIDFRGGRQVVEVNGETLECESGEEISSDLIVWSTGIKCPEVVQESFGCDAEGLEVNSGLSCENFENVFALGDCADHGVEKTAHHAMRMGEVVARNLEKPDKQPLEDYETGFDPLIVSIGDTALITGGGFTYRNFMLRYLKDLVRIGYFLSIKKKRLFLKFFG
ncbi:MAG: NAD(P)/FAD-dependent oxidoreductase [Candidatus Nanohaloarchaea archaeon]